jgi:APA family basic amino acid/polyamine antiporter
MAQDGVFFKKAAELNQASVPAWSLGAVYLGLCLTGKYGDLLDFVVIIVLIFYILTILGILSFVKCQMDRIKHSDIHFTCTLHNHCFGDLYCVIVHQNKYERLGVVIMLIGIPVYFDESKGVVFNYE